MFERVTPEHQTPSTWTFAIRIHRPFGHGKRSKAMFYHYFLYQSPAPISLPLFVLDKFFGAAVSLYGRRFPGDQSPTQETELLDV